jgi:hypothetical protein
MTIGRMQMNKQLYGIGSKSLSENGRDRFGLGSFIRKIIPNEISKIAVKAAPFVAPFNPALAAGMAGIGGYDQTGKFGSSLGKAALVYGGGQAARYLGGAGFQQGINPFAGYNPASSFGGISSLFTSPIGTQTGLQLGQYEMFGGPGADAFRAGQVTDPGVVVPDYVGGGTDIDQFGSIQDYLAQTDPKNPLLTEAQRASEIAKQAGKTLSERTATEVSRGYMDITKDLFSGDITARGNAAKELGGKALKDIYTTPITNQAGEIVGSKVDKTAVIATLAMIPSYLDAKKAADDAGIEEFDEATYNAERDKYMERYKANLPTSSFGIQTAANGGRIGYASGSEDPKFDPSNPKYKGINKKVVLEFIKEGIPLGYNSPEEYYEDFYNPIGMKNGGRIGYAEGSREGIVSLTDQNSGVVYRDPKTGEPLTIDEFLRRAAEDEAEVQLLKEGEEPGSQFISRPDDAPSIRLPEKGIRSLDTGDFENETKNISNSKKLKSKYESDPYVTQLLKRIGTEAFFGGEPNPTSKYREFDKMSPEYQDRVETRREKDRRFFQQPGYGVHTTREIPRYDDYGMEMKANGGRIGYGFGSLVKASGVATPVSEGTVRPLGTVLPSPVNNSRGGFGNMNLFSQMMDRFKQTPANNARGTAVNQLYNYYNDNEYDPEEEKRKKIMELYMRDNAKSGGRMGLYDGTEVPMRQNQGGISELDYRKTGGFVPVGVKEKADDVPAMLSKNEFVFTADAVKSSGWWKC